MCTCVHIHTYIYLYIDTDTCIQKHIAAPFVACCVLSCAEYGHVCVGVLQCVAVCCSVAARHNCASKFLHSRCCRHFL